MTDPRPDRGQARLTDSTGFRLVGESPDYGYRAENPVRYAEVRRGDVVLGWLWADDAAAAANFLPRPAAGSDAVMASAVWIDHLRAAKARGLTPSAAVATAQAVTSVEAGRAGAISVAAVSFADLQARAVR